MAHFFGSMNKWSNSTDQLKVNRNNWNLNDFFKKILYRRVFSMDNTHITYNICNITYNIYNILYILFIYVYKSFSTTPDKGLRKNIKKKQMEKLENIN